MTLAEQPTGDHQELIRGLNDEARLLQQFVDLLLLEQKALSAGSTDDLPPLAEEKSKLAVQLDRIAEYRGKSLVAMGFSADRKGIEAWCARFPTDQTAAHMWEKVVDLAHEAQALNRLNGELIQLRMNVTAAAMESLRVGKSSLELYGPDGQSAKADHRRIDHAV